MAALSLGSLGADELQQLSQLLQLIRSGSPELKALLGKTKPQKTAKTSTSSSAAASPGQTPAQRAKGRWRDGRSAAQQRQTQDGWVTVKTQKDKKEKTDEPKSGDVLLQEGISVPVKASFADMSANDTGICLCSTSEAKRALAMMWSDKPAAVLSPKNIEGRGVEKDVLVKDKDGRIQGRRRFVFQLGYGAVGFARVAPQRNVSTDSVRMVINMHEDGAASWKAVMKDPTSATRQWFNKHVKTGLLETRSPTRTPGVPGLQVLVYVAQASSTKLLKASGADNVFTREFYENDADRAKFRVVPCQDGCSLKTAAEQASHMGDDAFGVVRTRRGFGIRVRNEQYESVMMRLRPDDAHQFLGDRWEISGLPVTTGAEAVKEFVEGWTVHPLFSFRKGWRRTWVVRAATAPQQRVVEHQSGFAVIQEYHQRAGPPAAQKERWSPPKRTSTLHTSDFPPLQLAQRSGRQPPAATTAAAAPAAATALETATLGLEDRIAQAVAAAMAPFTAQIAALQSASSTSMGTLPPPPAPEPMEAIEEAGTPAQTAAPASTGADLLVAAQTAARPAPPSSYADRSSSAPYAVGGQNAGAQGSQS